MTIQEVLDHYGGIANVARALGISYQAVDQWTSKNEVPEGRQWQIQAMTDGKLKADEQTAA